jgi:hypothetical protein
MAVIKDLPNEEYHNRSEVSNTQLSLFSKDQYAIDWQKQCPVDEDKVKTFDFGDAMHAICLEPYRLDLEFAVMPPFNLRTNAGKEEKTEWLAENEGKKVLTFEEDKKLRLMFESVMAHPQARELIEAEGLAESSWIWKDKDTGVDCRCRPDKLIASLLVDVKTTPDLAKFHYSVDDYRYHVQNAFYCDGLTENGVFAPAMEFLVIQKTISIGRYPVMVYRLPEEAVEYGRAIYKQDLEAYSQYMDGHREPTSILEMSTRFNTGLDEMLSEVQI